jgi:rare lipoprotein A
MRSSISIVAAALALLTISSAYAHSRGFAWFFAHSRPHGACSGQSVVASYYTSGRRTASGEAFSSGGYTAAHRTLPFGSTVTVTNVENGRSATVVINDRGPFTRGVTLDLARGAARAIGMTKTQWVCIGQSMLLAAMLRRSCRTRCIAPRGASSYPISSVMRWSGHQLRGRFAGEDD